MCVGGAATTSAQDVDEGAAAQIKAGLLYHLAKLVTWPDSKFENEQSAIVVGFVGNDPHGIAGYFESQAQAVIAQARSLAVRQFQLAETAAGLDPAVEVDLRRCHILFVTASEEDRFAEISSSVETANVLAVGETESFPASGGMVAFVLERGRVGIRVSLEAIERARLALGAQFLQHAANVDSAAQE